MFSLRKTAQQVQWQPIGPAACWGWASFFAVFLIYAASQHGNGLFIDPANLVVHEGGHALFGWFGSTLGLWGGTLLQLLVPFLLATYFFSQRQVPGFAFCTFFFFENFLGIATYMADARAMQLPLVTIGDPEFTIHDWNAIFSSLGLLNWDTAIAAVVRVLGWTGMALVPVWLVIQGRRSREAVAKAS
jgi:hypothetical protein